MEGLQYLGMEQTKSTSLGAIRGCIEPEMTRVRLHWANGRVTELSADAKATIIRLPTGEGIRSFRATQDSR